MKKQLEMEGIALSRVSAEVWVGRCWESEGVKRRLYIGK